MGTPDTANNALHFFVFQDCALHLLLVFRHLIGQIWIFNSNLTNRMLGHNNVCNSAVLCTLGQNPWCKWSKTTVCQSKAPFSRATGQICVVPLPGHSGQSWAPHLYYCISCVLVLKQVCIYWHCTPKHYLRHSFMSENTHFWPSLPSQGPEIQSWQTTFYHSTAWH